MKKTILLLAFLFPLLANAMKIATDEVDEFTGERTVITSWESIAKHYMHVRFRLQNGIIFLDFKYISDGAIVIGSSDQLMFKATDNSIVKFTPTRTFSGGLGDGAVGIGGASHWGISATYTGDVAWFETHCAKLLRIYATDGYRDKKLPEGDGNKLRALASLFCKSINLNDDEHKTRIVTCTLQYLKKKKRSSSWDVVETEYLENIYYVDLDKKINDWRAQSDDNVEYDVKVTRER